MPRTIEFPDELRASLEEALRLISHRAPSQLRQATECRRALEAGSPILHHRMERLVEASLGSSSSFTAGEHRALGEALADLAEFFAGRPGPKPRGNTRRLMVFLTDEEGERLDRHMRRLNAPAAEVVRRGLLALDHEARLLGGGE